MKCFKCHAAMTSVKAYRLHFKMFHSSDDQDIVHCTFEGCGRIYNWVGFARHYQSHKEPCSNANLSLNENVIHGSVIDLQSMQCDNVQNDGSSAEVKVHESTLPDSFQTAFISKVESFVGKLYSNPKLPRSYVQSIVSDVNDLFCNHVLQQISESVQQALQTCGANTDQISHINSMFSVVQDSFKLLSTEYLRTDYFMKSGHFIKPERYEIGKLDTSVSSKNGQLLKEKKVYGQRICLDKILVKFFELPDVFLSVMSHKNSLEMDQDCIQNYMQSYHWKVRLAKYKDDDIVLPLFVFYDDCQCNNPLGSHADKLGAVYISLPCLPPECQGTIDNIFLALLFKSKYRNLFGDKNVFSPLIDELSFLEKCGISVNTPQGPKRIYFVTGLLLGDNLGVNSLGGFVESFTADFFCRFCKTSRALTFTQSIEDESSLRDEANYSDELALNNSKSTGLKANCVLNDIPSFHIITNYSVDTFHDLAEGVCHYVMLHVLKHCIPKYFSLDILNNRILLFDYGPCESNKVPTISDTFDTKSKLKMSGAETIVFVKLFGLLAGDKVPPSDPFWRLYLKLRQVLDVCFCKTFTRSQSFSLKVLVQELNDMYVSITKDTLKPKFHNLIHYARVRENSGPLEPMSAKRFESKHRALLIPAHATMSRRDIVYTLALKSQLNLCYRFMSNQSILKKTVVGPGDFLSLYDFDNFENVLRQLPNGIILSASNCFSPRWIEVKGTKFKPGMIILAGISDIQGPIFYKIEFILVVGDCMSFIVSSIINVGFDEHVHAYEVEFTCKYLCIDPHSIYEPLPLYAHRAVSGTLFVVLRHSL